MDVTGYYTKNIRDKDVSDRYWSIHQIYIDSPL